MSTSYSDGEIYYQVRRLQRKREDYSSVKGMLSICKQRALEHLLSKPMICRALDRVMKFPGLRSGLQLGNIDKNLATNCDELIINNFKWISKYWFFLVQRKKAARCYVNEDTVQLLEFRVPCVNREDKAVISFAMNSYMIFPGIHDEKTRNEIQALTWLLKAVIPSLATFHENMKYIGIGAKILKTHLDIPLGKASKFKPRKTTLYERLANSWDKNCHPLMEIDEGHFLPLTGRPSSWIAFEQLFLSVLRQFPRLSSETPLRDFRSEAMPAGTRARHLHMLFQRASILGFSNKKIKEGLTRSIFDARIPNFKPTIREPVSDWRGGKPFVRSFLALQKILFMPNLGQSSSNINGPTVDFVCNDVITAFFGKQEFDLDHTGSKVTIDGVGPSTNHFSTVMDDNGKVEEEAHDSNTAMQDEDGNIEMETRASDTGMAMEQNPDTPQTAARRIERLALKRKRILQRRYDPRRTRRPKNDSAPEHFQELASSQELAHAVNTLGQKEWKTKPKPTRRKRLAGPRPKQRLSKGIAKLNHRFEESQGTGRRSRLRYKPSRLVARLPPAVTSTIANEDPSPKSLPDPSTIPENSDDNRALVVYNPIVAGPEGSEIDFGSTNRALPPHGLDPGVGPSHKALQGYVHQRQAIRVPPQIPSMADAVSEDSVLPAPKGSAHRTASRTARPVDLSGHSDARQAPMSAPEAEHSKPEALTDEGTPSNGSSSPWTDTFPVIDESEALLHHNTTVGELYVPQGQRKDTAQRTGTDETEHNKPSYGMAQKKRKRQFDPRDTDGVRTGELEPNPVGREVLIREVRPIPFKRRRIGTGVRDETEHNKLNDGMVQKKRKRQADPRDTDEEVRTGELEPNSVGREVLIREAQPITFKRRRIGTELGQSITGESGGAAPLSVRQPHGSQALGIDHGIVTEGLTNIPLTPAEMSNVRHAAMGRGLQPRLPLAIPGEFGT